jgi:hypothetical protein
MDSQRFSWRFVSCLRAARNARRGFARRARGDRVARKGHVFPGLTRRWPGRTLSLTEIASRSR